MQEGEISTFLQEIIEYDISKPADKHCRDLLHLMQALVRVYYVRRRSEASVILKIN